MSLEDELTIALVGEENATLEEAFAVDSGVSFEMTTGKNQALPQLSTT